MILSLIGIILIFLISQFFTYTYIGGCSDWSYTEITNEIGFYGCQVLGVILMWIDFRIVIRDIEKKKSVQKE